MPRLWHAINAFTAGELSPRMKGRSDFAGFFSGAAELLNWYVFSQGGLCRRPGLHYLGDTLVPSAPSRLIPFLYSLTDSYQLEFAPHLLGFWWGDGRVADPSTGLPYTLVTPWGKTHYASLRGAHSADVMWITDGSQQPRKLSRYGHASWTLLPIAFHWGPFLEMNRTAITLTPSAITGSFTLTASSSFFDSGHVGALFKLYQELITTLQTITEDFAYGAENTLDNVPVTFTGTGVGEAIRIPANGTLRYTITGTWVGTIVLQRSYNGSTSWSTIITTTTNVNDTITNTSGGDLYYRWNCTVYTSGTATATLKHVEPPFEGEDEDEDEERYTTEAVTVPTGEQLTYQLTGTWTGTMALQRSWDGGENWEDYQSHTANVDDTEANNLSQQVLFRWKCVSIASGTVTATLIHKKLETAEGIVRVTAFSSDTVVTVELQVSDDEDHPSELLATTATDKWWEGAWSDYRGWPAAVALQEQRLWFAGTSSRPLTFWSSVTNDFTNFREGPLDTDAIVRTVSMGGWPDPGMDKIHWMKPGRYLLMGTANAELRVGSATGIDPITPTNCQVVQERSYGSIVEPIRTGHAAVFIERGGRSIRELVYSIEEDGLVAPSLSVLAEHLFRSGAVELAAIKSPQEMLFVRRADGLLAVMTHERENKVVAWKPWETEGSFASVAVRPAAAGDQLWTVVGRYVGGALRYMVERAVFDEPSAQADAFCVDSGLTFDGSPATNFSGLGHLAQCSDVVALGDGAVINPPPTVSAAGETTLLRPVSKLHIGRRYTSRLRTLPIDMPPASGPVFGRLRHIVSATLRVLNTLGLKSGTRLDELDVIPIRTSADSMGGPPQWYSGDLWVSVPGDWGYASELIIEVSDPVPAQLLSLVVGYEVGDDE